MQPKPKQPKPKQLRPLSPFVFLIVLSCVFPLLSSGQDGISRSFLDGVLSAKPLPGYELPPLLKDARRGDLESVRRHLALGADIKQVQKATGMDALAIAVHHGHNPLVSFLVRNGAPVNSAGVHGITPLMRAALKGDLAVVEYLLRHGADPQLADKGGRVATAHYAMQGGNPAVVERLVKAGGRLDTPDKRGVDALHIAASAKQPALLKLALDGRRDPDPGTNHGLTPLTSAVLVQDLDAVRLLLRHKARPEHVPAAVLREAPDEIRSLLQ